MRNRIIALLLTCVYPLALGAVEPGDLVTSSSRHQYIVERRLGSGFFSQVWQVRDIRSGRRFAAKFFDKSKLKRRVLRTYERISELQARGWLNGLLRVYPPETFYFEVASEEPAPVVRSELAESNVEKLEVEDFLLEKAVDDSDLLVRIRRASDLVHQVLRGIQEMKDSGINHHDLNPRNILLSHGTFKIGDLDSIEPHGVRPAGAAWELFSAPIQYGLRGFSYSDKNLSDVYQLASTVYRLMLGHYRLQEILRDFPHTQDIQGLREFLQSHPTALLDEQTAQNLDRVRFRIMDNVPAARQEPYFSQIHELFDFLIAALKLDLLDRAYALSHLPIMREFNLGPQDWTTPPPVKRMGAGRAIMMGCAGLLVFGAFSLMMHRPPGPGPI